MTSDDTNDVTPGGDPASPRGGRPGDRGHGRTPVLDVRARLNASLVAAVAISVVTLLLTVIRLNDRDFTNIQISPVTTFTQVLSICLVPAIVLLFVMIAAGMTGLLRRWYLAALCGLAGGVAGGVIGYFQLILSGGVPFAASMWQSIMLDFLGTNFSFLAFSVLCAAFMGPALMRRGAREAEDEQLLLRANLDDPRRFAQAEDKLAFVRVPSSAPEDAEVTFIEREPVDADRMSEQWEAYVAILEEHGWATAEIAAAPTMPDSVFTEDQAVLLGDVAILARSGAESRRGELAGTRAALADEGFVMEEIQAPGTLDGGDVLVTGSTILVGASGRTNASGIRQLRRIAGELGYRVTAVPVAGALHLRTVATALPDGTVVAWADALPEPALLGRFLSVPEPSGASLLPLDGETVLVAASAPKTAKLIQSLGYQVKTINISEFEKLEGGVTCLSLRAAG